MIENPSTANFLIAHGVRYGQGYLYGKPSPDLPILAKPAD
jgi:EAL domain-containing protein (putative c-di-GMP-specific phosphodiesterase class I)